jgi:hypothetical protein
LYEQRLSKIYQFKAPSQKTDVAVARQVKIARGITLARLYLVRTSDIHIDWPNGMPWTVVTTVFLMWQSTQDTQGRLTQQEKRLFQDLDHTTDRHSNGLSTKEEL